MTRAAEGLDDFRQRARTWLAANMAPIGDGWNDRSDERPSKPSRARHALTIVSCTASSASDAAPSIR